MTPCSVSPRELEFVRPCVARMDLLDVFDLFDSSRDGVRYRHTVSTVVVAAAAAAAHDDNDDRLCGSDGHGADDGNGVDSVADHGGRNNDLWL